MPIPALLLALGLILAPSVAAAEDRPPPSLALPSDVVTRAPRWVVAVSARAPWQRSYSLGIAYAVSRHLAFEARLGIDEKQRLIAGGGVALRPLGGRLEGPLLRVGASYRAATDTNASPGEALCLDALAGGSLVMGGAYVETGAGVLGVVGESNAGLRASFILEARLGLVF